MPPLSYSKRVNGVDKNQFQSINAIFCPIKEGLKEKLCIGG